MSICRYFKPADGLPDPKGTLSGHITPEAISMANTEVQKALSEQGKKRGPYIK